MDYFGESLPYESCESFFDRAMEHRESLFDPDPMERELASLYRTALSAYDSTIDNGQGSILSLVDRDLGASRGGWRARQWRARAPLAHATYAVGAPASNAVPPIWMKLEQSCPKEPLTETIFNWTIFARVPPFLLVCKKFQVAVWIKERPIGAPGGPHAMPGPIASVWWLQYDGVHGKQSEQMINGIVGPSCTSQTEIGKDRKEVVIQIGVEPRMKMCEVVLPVFATLRQGLEYWRRQMKQHVTWDLVDDPFGFLGLMLDEPDAHSPLPPGVIKLIRGYVEGVEGCQWPSCKARATFGKSLADKATHCASHIPTGYVAGDGAAFDPWTLLERGLEIV